MEVVMHIFWIKLGILIAALVGLDLFAVVLSTPPVSTSKPSSQPSRQPSSQPTRLPSSQPSRQPSAQPSNQPSSQPFGRPSVQPSRQPSSHPSQPSCQPSMQPSRQPSGQPSTQPSSLPSSQPSLQPSSQPSSHPSQPSCQPSMQPSRQPTMQPSTQPSSLPSSQPSTQPYRKPSAQPSRQPTMQPSMQPSRLPSTQPSMQPSRKPSAQPSQLPSMQPSAQPSCQPSSNPSSPSSQPSAKPSNPSSQPSIRPSSQPSRLPSIQPSTQPSNQPSMQPSRLPSSQPSTQPSLQPTMQPSRQPSTQPSTQPSSQPSCQPFSHPSTQPTSQPLRQPSDQPSTQPTITPSMQPSIRPTLQPSSQPSRSPSTQPSNWPSAKPSRQPSSIPTEAPIITSILIPQPTSQPSTQPSMQPSCYPSSQPSMQPSMQPSFQPFSQPSTQPTSQPLRQPSNRPSAQPSRQPSSIPTDSPIITSILISRPSSQPSTQPSMQPSKQPSSQPSMQPSMQPSTQPSTKPSTHPSRQPSSQPSVRPSNQPSSQPLKQPSARPSSQPSSQPSHQPTNKPSSHPSMQPSMQPSMHPSRQPTSHPSLQPSSQPSMQPSFQPSTHPSMKPFRQPSSQPSRHPSVRPSTQPSRQPTRNPTTAPSSQPSIQPSRQPSSHPFMQPSSQPSFQPSSRPSTQPSTQPTSLPSSQPSKQPSRKPSSQPSIQPSTQPSRQPLSSPTEAPITSRPTKKGDTNPPTLRPTIAKPTSQPSSQPSRQPSRQPSSQPSRQPFSHPSAQPSIQPSSLPSSSPSNPSSQPSCQPSSQPSRQPTQQPTTQPSMQPSMHPSMRPTSQPSRQPTSRPSNQPSIQPSRLPTGQPSSLPSTQPTNQPSSQPSRLPTSLPSMQPSRQPSSQPSSQPSTQPSSQPSSQPSLQPTIQPSSRPSSQPSLQPSNQPSSNPSNPSSQPSIQPSTQPSSAPSKKGSWTVLVTSMDDFLDPASIPDINSFDFDYYCTNENWRTTGPTDKCTLRLAIYYCLFKFPWDNFLYFCEIFIPHYSALDFRSSFQLVEDRYQKLYTNGKMRIILNFQRSSFIVTDSLRVDFGISDGFHDVNLMIKNVTFDDSIYYKNMNVGLFILNVHHLELDGVEFNRTFLNVRNSSQVEITYALVKDNFGGSKALDLNRIGNVSITNSIFSNNKFGALSIVDAQVVAICFSHFENNSALLGSAIFLHKVHHLAIVANNEFVSNIADHAGTLYWISEQMPPPKISSNNKWTNNDAKYYGNTSASSFCGVACIRVSPATILYNDYTNISLPTDIKVAIVDYYGSVITSYNNQVKVSANKLLSKCTGFLMGTYFLNDAKVVNNVNSKSFLTFFLNKGLGSFANVGVRCLPSGFMVIGLSMALIVPDDFGNLNRANAYSQNLNVTFRNCKRGEVFDLFSLTQSSCSECRDTFSLNDNNDFDTVATQCRSCPPEALGCYADQVYLKSGSWRQSKTSYSIYPCQSEYACQGSNLTSDENCNIGHHGPICGLCKESFFLSSAKQCVRCDSRLLSNILSLLVIFIVFVAGGYIYSKHWQVIYKYYDTFMSTLIGILIYAYQIITLGAASSPTFNTFSATSNVANSAKIMNLDFTTAFSLTCYFDTNFFGTLKYNILAPVVVVFPMYLTSVYTSSDNFRRLLYYYMLSFLAFILPTVSAVLFKMFKCVEISSKSYLVTDLSIECSGDDYNFYLIWVYAAILVYPVGVPLLLLNFLYKRKDLITNRALLKKCNDAFTYTNLRDDLHFNFHFSILQALECFYAPYKSWWFDVFEIIIRLLLTSIIRAFLDDEKLIIVISFLVTLFSFRVQYKFNPYCDDYLNHFASILKIQIVFVYYAVYIRLNNGLEMPPDSGETSIGTYKQLDLSLLLFSIFALLVGLRFGVAHVRSLNTNSLASVVPDISADEKRRNEILETMFKDSCVLELEASCPLKDLLRAQAVLFFRLAPIGTYQMLKLNEVDVGNITNALHASSGPPKTFVYGREQSRVYGDITVFALGRTKAVSKLKIALRAGFSSIYFSLLIYLNRDLYDREKKLQFRRSRAALVNNVVKQITTPISERDLRALCKNDELFGYIISKFKDKVRLRNRVKIAPLPEDRESSMDASEAEENDRLLKMIVKNEVSILDFEETNAGAIDTTYTSIPDKKNSVSPENEDDKTEELMKAFDEPGGLNNQILKIRELESYALDVKENFHVFDAHNADSDPISAPHTTGDITANDVASKALAETYDDFFELSSDGSKYDDDISLNLSDDEVEDKIGNNDSSNFIINSDDDDNSSKINRLTNNVVNNNNGNISEEGSRSIGTGIGTMAPRIHAVKASSGGCSTGSIEDESHCLVRGDEIFDLSDSDGSLFDLSS